MDRLILSEKLESLRRLEPTLTWLNGACEGFSPSARLRKPWPFFVCIRRWLGRIH